MATIDIEFEIRRRSDGGVFYDKILQTENYVEAQDLCTQAKELR